MTSIANEQYTNQVLIGNGSYGSVYKVSDTKGCVSALKQYSRVSTDLDIGCLREISILHKIKDKNPHIISIRDIIITPTDISIIVPIYQTDLFDAICNNILDKSVHMTIMRGTLDGLSYLHSVSIIHRDIKPDNIMIDSEYNPVIIDFTLSKTVHTFDTSHSNNVCAKRYRAPELRGMRFYSFKIDVWSLGVVFLELYMNRLLSDDDNIRKCIGNIPDIHIKCLIDKMTKTNIKQRWAAIQCLNFSFSNVLKRIQKNPIKYDTLNIPDSIDIELEHWFMYYNVEKDVTKMAAITYINNTDCSYEHAVVLACKLYEDNWYTSEDATYITQELRILKEMNYNLLII